MDCCNYMQYRHHQPYYGNHYYDPLPPYHGEFYGHHMYQDYYGNTPYYNPSPQQWCTTTSSFPSSDYVYNPKEARIRKAMRDASRERNSIGASPMLPRPNARRASHSWISPQEELLMGPMSIRNIAEGSSLCGFPLQPGNNHFISQMNPNYKMEPHQPPPPPPPPTNYLQSSPLAQLQQHTEMWHEYQTMRPRSSGNPFMMPEVQPYHPQPPPQPLPSSAGDLSNVAAMSRQIPSPNNLQQQQQQRIVTPPQSHTNENVPPAPITPVQTTAVPTNELINRNPDFGNGKINSSPNFSSAFDTQQQDGSNKVEDNIKKPLTQQIHNTNNNTTASKKSANKPLPDFNEAFGSTERGRFQSPPDPRLAPNKGYLDYFFDSNPIKFDDYQI